MTLYICEWNEFLWEPAELNDPEWPLNLLFLAYHAQLQLSDD